MNFKDFYLLEDTTQKKTLDKEETIALLKDDSIDRCELLNISNPIISEFVIDEMKKCQEEKGFQVNSQIAKYIIQKNNLELSNEQEEKLGTLIYNAQKEIVKRKDEQEGFRVYSSEELETLVGREMEIKTEGLFGDRKNIGKVIKVGENFGIQPKRMTRKYYPINYYNMKLRLVK
jgi:hypothetical protein